MLIRISFQLSFYPSKLLGTEIMLDFKVNFYHIEFVEK